MKKTSQTIAKFAYERNNKALYIQFTSGKEYIYFQVPEKTAKAMKTAEKKGKSIGRFFIDNVRNQYDFGILS